MAEKTIEEMKAELEAAGYWFTTSDDELYDGTFWTVRLPGGHWECGYSTDIPCKMDEECTEFLVTHAYAHLLQERQYQAMKAFVERVAHYDVQANFNQYMSDREAIANANSSNLENFVDEAKKLLGK